MFADTGRDRDAHAPGTAVVYRGATDGRPCVAGLCHGHGERPSLPRRPLTSGDRASKRTYVERDKALEA